MPDGNSLINFGEISKPASVLIKKVSNAVGVLYEPRRIRNRARAEADAEKIKALASIELNQIQRRAIDRLIRQEARKQRNIEAITAQAIASLGEDAEVEKLEEDWVAHFFKQCDSVSDKEMQSLWSRMLLGEATKPGTFSKRTVDFVASMDKKDAQLFTEFCQFCWFVDESTPLIFDTRSDILVSKGINFDALKYLDSIGLISYESIPDFCRKGFGKYVETYYFDTPLLIEFANDSDNKIVIGKVLLTRIGLELVRICGARPNKDFYEYIVDKWYKQGLVLSTPLVNRVG